VLPLQFKDGLDRKQLGLTGMELFDVTGVEAGLKPRMDLDCCITYADGKTRRIKLFCRVDTLDEVEYYRHGGILPYVLRSLAA
jgi:aconitate hydratase